MSDYDTDILPEMIDGRPPLPVPVSALSRWTSCLANERTRRDRPAGARLRMALPQ
jgi:hypothetical protein